MNANLEKDVTVFIEIENAEQFLNQNIKRFKQFLLKK